MNLLTKGSVMAASVSIALGLSLPAHSDLMNSVDTVSGPLTVKKGPNNSFSILLGEKPIYETIDYSVSFSRVLSGYPKADRILMHLSTGGTACPAMFRIIDLSKLSWIDRVKSVFIKPKIVSSEFGTCDERPIVRSSEGQIAFDFGSQEGPVRWTYALSDRKLTEKQLSVEAYKAIKLAAIAAAVAAAVREHGARLEQLNDDLPSTVHENFFDKNVFIENGEGSISEWMRLGDVVALILSNKNVERVTAVHYALDENIPGIAIEFKGTRKKPLGVLFEAKGQKLYYRFFGASGDLAPVRSLADNASVASAVWDMMGADEL
jgi:hypothetical protein